MGKESEEWRGEESRRRKNIKNRVVRQGMRAVVQPPSKQYRCVGPFRDVRR